MSRARRVWRLRPQDPPAAQRLARDLNTSEVVAQLLRNRGIETAPDGRMFLDSPLSALHPPGNLPGVGAAADRIVAALAEKRKIVVFGDYDVDGTTGTALLVRLFEKLGGKPRFYIPHRQDEGYGLSGDALRGLKADGAELVITVDCGITAVKEAEIAAEIGLELIVTDHHEFGPALPRAAAVVHPRLPGANYPFGDLSGAGVALKLAWAICQRVSKADRVTPELREFLLDAVGLAALGLVADVVPLRGENRILVKHGLQRLAAKPPLGIMALAEAAGLNVAKVQAEDISFKLGPRLNAAGRLDCAALVVELLTTRNADRAKELAEILEGFNKQRQTIERRITAEAKELVLAGGYDTAAGIVLAAADWHQGVIGVVAGRLTEHFAKPCVLIALKPNDEPSTGSGRSIPGLALHEALNACTNLLVSHGGHAMAAGVKVRESQLDAFREAFAAHIATVFPDGNPTPVMHLDAEVPLSALTLGLLKEIDKLEPYGAENPKPRFLVSEVTVVEGSAKKIGQGERHMSFRVRQGGTTMRAVAFGMGDRLDELLSAQGSCCLAFTPKVNEWNGYKNVEVEVVDFCAGVTPNLE